MSGHTPGPWRYEPRTDYPNGHVEGIWGPDGEEIVVTDSCYYQPRIEDASLIAAAPELLAALKDYVAACMEQGLRLGAITGAAEAAIAKAEGRQP